MFVILYSSFFKSTLSIRPTFGVALRCWIMYSKYFLIVFCAVIMTMISKGEFSGGNMRSVTTTRTTASTPLPSTSEKTTIEGIHNSVVTAPTTLSEKNDKNKKTLEDSRAIGKNGKHNTYNIAFSIRLIEILICIPTLEIIMIIVCSGSVISVMVLLVVLKLRRRNRVDSVHPHILKVIKAYRARESIAVEVVE